MVFNCSGESGAGKTESAKLILQYLALLSGKHSQLEEKILSSGPILEAFGNACTVRNNNSSRFGKFIQIQFSPEGVIKGGKINEYILEKSRIVKQAPNERNYHVFYQFIKSVTEKEKAELRLESVSSYYYLKQGNLFDLTSVDDKEDFEKLKNALDNFGIPTSVQNDAFKTLALILHLGNIEFVAKKDTEECCVKDKKRKFLK